MHLSNHVFRSQHFYLLIFFSKCSKFNVDYKNAKKILQNVFGFLDNWI